MTATTTTVLAPQTAGNPWGYWRVEDMTGLPAAGKRRRAAMHFILTNAGLGRFAEHFGGEPTCCYCKQAIENDGKVNPYGLYNPRTKRAKLWHYVCGWGALLNDVIVDERPNRILVAETIQL